MSRTLNFQIASFGFILVWIQFSVNNSDAPMDNLSKFESDLWEAADNLRANSKLTSSDYFMPVLGIIFLRHAANRQIAEDQASGKMPKRKVLPADYIRRRARYGCPNRPTTMASWKKPARTRKACPSWSATP